MKHTHFFSRAVAFLTAFVLFIGLWSFAGAEQALTWYQSGPYRYVLLEDGTVKIDRYGGLEETVAVPSELDGKKVTAIGDEAFADYYYYNTMGIPDSGPLHVVLPEGVVSIGSHAFDGCVRLESIVIPDSVVSIGDLAFHNCFALTDISLPAGLTHLGAHPLFLLSPEKITLSADHPCFEIRDGMLFRKADQCLVCAPAPEGLEHCEIPEGTLRVGDYAFVRRSDLASVSFPDSLLEIGNYAFLECYRLSGLTLPEGLTSIGGHAFESCSGLHRTEITIPDSVTFVGDNPFFHVGPVLLFSENHPCLEVADGMLYSKPDHRLICRFDSAPENVSVREGTQMVGDEAFEMLPLPEGFVLPEGLTSIGEQAFADFDPEMLASLQYRTLSELKLPASLTRIGALAFSMSNYRALELPESVTDIGPEAFAGSRLNSFTVPGSVVSLPRGAFRGCFSLADVTLEQGVEYIGERAFESCNALTRVSLPDGLRFIGDRAFRSSPLTEIILPESVEYIGNEAFALCNLECLELPASVTALGNRAFQNCKAKEIRVSPDHPFLVVSDGALIDTRSGDVLWVTASDDGRYVIPQGTKTIRDYLFYSGGLRGSVEIPDSVTAIGEYAFCNAGTLGEIRIPGSVKTIGAYAFSGVGRLTGVTLEEGIEEIGPYAFSMNLTLQELRIPDSIVSIGENAFADCRRLTVIVSPGSYAEQYCIENQVNYANP